MNLRSDGMLAVAILIVFDADPGSAQAPISYHRPDRIDLYDNVARVDTGETYASCMYTELYPVGWSRRGEFAYLTFFDDYDASGMVWSSLFIYDVGKDTIAARRSLEKEYWTDTPFDTIWYENEDAFKNILDSFAIVQLRSTLGKFPVEIPGPGGIGDRVKYTWRAEKHWDDGGDGYYGFPCYDSLVITLYKVKNGKDKDGSGRAPTIFSECGKYVAIGYSVPGYFQSPFDPGLVFIPLVLVHRGWEGPPHTTSITPIGVVLK